MSRERAKEGIRAKARRDGYQTVHFEEYPGHWIASPERDREKALTWARRNRERLINRKVNSVKFYCEGFFAQDGKWAQRMREKGRHFIGQHLRNMQAYLDNHFVPAFGDLDPREIKRRDIDDWLLGLKKLSGKKASGATKYKIMSALNLLFEDLRDLDVIEVSPMAGIRPYSKNPENPRGAIDRDSLEKLFPATHGELVKVWGASLWAAIMLLFYDTGSRPGEVRALTWQDIDTRKRFIPIRRGIEAGTANTVKGTKTGVVKAGFLTARTVQELEVWRAESKYSADGDFVFTRNGRQPVTNNGIVKAFRRGLESAGIENSDWTPYWLRHSFGTYQLEVLAEEEISRLMGNGVQVLRRHYLHPDDATLYESTKGIQGKMDKAREVREAAVLAENKR
jgi:integrase